MGTKSIEREQFVKLLAQYVRTTGKPSEKPNKFYETLEIDPRRKARIFVEGSDITIVYTENDSIINKFEIKDEGCTGLCDKIMASGGMNFTTTNTHEYRDGLPHSYSHSSKKVKDKDPGVKMGYSGSQDVYSMVLLKLAGAILPEKDLCFKPTETK